MTKNSTSGQDEARQFIERIERIQQEKKDLAEHEKEAFAEAKARGFDTKIMRKLISERKRDPDDVAEEEAVLEMYRAALGMAHSLSNSTGEADDAAAMV